MSNDKSTAIVCLGGAGVNFVNRLGTELESLIDNADSQVEIYAVNSDPQHLMICWLPDTNRIFINPHGDESETVAFDNYPTISKFLRENELYGYYAYRAVNNASLIDILAKHDDIYFVVSLSGFSGASILMSLLPDLLRRKTRFRVMAIFPFTEERLDQRALNVLNVIKSHTQDFRIFRNDKGLKEWPWCPINEMFRKIDLEIFEEIHTHLSI